MMHDDPDPRDGVDFPRDRKPWKRDRDAVRFEMQRAINARRAQHPLGRYDNGEGYGYRDHIERLRCLAEVAYARRRLMWDKREGKQMRSVVLGNLAAAHRLIEGASFRDRVPLP